MSNDTFNLVDRPWIPCAAPSGALKLCGLVEALCRAHELREVRDSSPLVTISLHRLLLAILHRVFGPETSDLWAQLWKSGSGIFNRAILEAYLRAPDIYTRFDLFDEQHPFYQTASLPLGEVDRSSGRPRFVKPVCRLAHELAYSDNRNVFSHFAEDNWEIRPAHEVARWLVAFQAFALGGLITAEEGKRTRDGSADGGQLVKSAVVLAKGDSLFQTLMLNLVQYSAAADAPFAFRADADKPAWERNGETRPEDRRYDGYLDLLTWQSRRVRLVPARDSDGSILGVSGVVAMKGFQLPDLLRRRRETMVCFVKNDNARGAQDSWPPLGFRNEKEPWRDCPLFLQSAVEKSERPKTLSWISTLQASGNLKRSGVWLDIAGLCSDRARIFFWRHESYLLPLAYLSDETLLAALKMVMDLAEQVENALVAAVWLAAAIMLKPDKTDASPGKKDGAAIDRSVRSFDSHHIYWLRLAEPFRRLMPALAESNGPDREERIKNWYAKSLFRSALAAYRQTAGGLDHSAQALHASVSGEKSLHRALGLIKRKHPLLGQSKRKNAEFAT